MISAITIKGLGPYRHRTRLELGPGRTEITGPSQSGKSTIVDAIAWTLTGRAARAMVGGGRALSEDALTDELDSARVDLECYAGPYRRITREILSLSPRRYAREIIYRDGREESYSREGDFTAALGRLGRDADLVGLVVAPLAWIGPSRSAGGGSDLRGQILRLLPPVDRRSVVAALLDSRGGELGERESIDEGVAKGRRTKARRQCAELEGEIEGLRRHLAKLAARDLPEAPDEATVTAAFRVVEAAQAWVEFGEAQGARARRAVWEAQRAQLEDPGPAPDPGPLNATQAELADVRDRRAALMSDLDRARELEGLLAEPSHCPTCGQAWENEDRRGAWRRELEELRRRETVEEREQLREIEEQLAEQLAEQREASDRWHEAQHRYVYGLQALGPPPVVPEIEEPTPDRPAPEVYTQAQAVIRQAEGAQGAAHERTEQRHAIMRRLGAAAAELEGLRDHVAHLELLLEAVRYAPGRICELHAAALGDLGPVELRWTETGVDVLVDGRLWHLASSGRLVIADLHLRAALRRALRLPLPIIVDNVQAVGGLDWPEVPGPLVLLRTTAGRALEFHHS